MRNKMEQIELAKNKSQIQNQVSPWQHKQVNIFNKRLKFNKTSCFEARL